MTDITFPDKVTGDTLSGVEATEIKTVVNLKADKDSPIFSTSVRVGDDVSYSNSMVNVGRDVTLLGNEYDVMQYSKTSLLSTSSPGSNTVAINTWADVDLKGGSPDHVVGLLGQARSSDASTIGSFLGTEGKAYANVNGSTATGLQGFSYLNAADNSASTSYGISAFSSALQGASAGISIGGVFSGTGGHFYADLMLAGSKQMIAWTSTYTGINKFAFEDAGINLTPIAGGKVIATTNTLQITTPKTPASATAAGSTGDIVWDSGYLYVCVATDTWKRSALTTW